MNLFYIVPLVVCAILVFFQIRTLRRLGRFRELNNRGYDCCIRAVELHTSGQDWRPAMQEAVDIKREMNKI